MQLYYPDKKQAVLLFVRLIALILLFLAPYALVRLFVSKADFLTIFDSYYFYTIKILSQVVVFLWAVKQIRKTSLYDFKREFNFLLTKSWFFGFLGIIALIFIIEPLETRLPSTSYFQNHFVNLIKLPYASFAFIVIFSPFTEEFIFRGVILRGLLRNHSAPVAIVVSTLLFSLFHITILQASLAFIIGLYIAYVYWQTRSLALCILLHSFNNSAAYIILLLTGKVQSLEGLIANTKLYLIIYLIAASLVSISVLQIYKLNDRFK